MAELDNPIDRLKAFDKTHTAVTIEAVQREEHERNVYRETIKSAQSVLRISNLPTESVVKMLIKVFFGNEELAKLMEVDNG